MDVRGLFVKRGGRSQTAFILVNLKTGSRTICWQRPTVMELSPDEVDPSFIKGIDLLLLDGLMFEASLKAARIARGLNIPVMLDAGRLRCGTLKLAAISDYIVCSEDLAKDLKSTPEAALKKLGALNPGAVVTVTLGKKGSITCLKSKTFFQPAFKIKAIDTTGAGDVFHGGYIWGILNRWDIGKTVEFASAFAALKCLKPGGRTGIPTLAEAFEFIRAAARRRF